MIIANLAALGTASVFGGIAGTRMYVDDARTAANTYFEIYFSGLTGDERIFAEDAFRHAFVSGALAMETSDTYAALNQWGQIRLKGG